MFSEMELNCEVSWSYLKSSLHGTSANAISGISITNDNYDTAIKLLGDKFGMKVAIVETLYSHLQHLQMAMNKTGDIKFTYESIEKILRQLEAQGEDISHQRILVQQILSKFPLQVIVRVEESKILEDVWTVPLLRKSLQRYVTIFTNPQCYEFNARSSNFSIGGKRFDNSCAFRPDIGFTGNDTVTTEAFVTNSSVTHQRNRSGELRRPCVL